MTSASAFGKEVVVSCGWYMFENLRNLGLEIVEMRCPYGSCSSIVSNRVGWAVISNVPVGKASKSGLIGCVVYVVWRGSHPHWRCGGLGGAVLIFFLWCSLLIL
jgi:hypothetical protein